MLLHALLLCANSRPVTPVACQQPQQRAGSAGPGTAAAGGFHSATATINSATRGADAAASGHSVTRLQPLAPGVGRVGVQLQWGTDPLQPGLIANLSHAFDAARIDFLWTTAERQRGNYTFRHYDRLQEQLKLHNVTAAWNLDYGNDLWQNGTGVPYSVAVTTPEAVAAFARFAVASVRHFRGQGIVWGIYDEPNGHGTAPYQTALRCPLCSGHHVGLPLVGVALRQHS